MILASAFRHATPLATVALFAAIAPAQNLKVALCAAAGTINTCQWNDPQTRLMATGLFSTVDIINVVTAGQGTTLAQLLAYDAVMCWTNTTPNNTIAWGDALADYVDAGGGVVVTVFANSTLTANRNIGGRWQTGYEVILDQSGNTTGAGATLGTVSVPTHPVMNGVTSFSGGTTGSRPVGTALEVGATLIASWSDGKVLVAQGANPRRIDLGFYPVNATCSQSGWATGGDVLMANALVFVATGGRFEPYGTGCSGALGVPTLAAATGSRPVLGGVFTVNAGNLPNGVAFLGIGFSNTQSGPFPLPLDLTVFGMPGCSLLADPLVTLLLVSATSTASHTMGFPADPTLQGLNIFLQTFPLDAAANPAGITVSNGGRARLGTT